MKGDCLYKRGVGRPLPTRLKIVYYLTTSLETLEYYVEGTNMVIQKVTKTKFI